MNMAQTAPRVHGTKVRGNRPSNRGPCSRCGIEMEYRNDRPDRTCQTCRVVDPMWVKR